MEGLVLGHFTILEKLGEGGMGVVYKARDTRLDRIVAIKVLPESKLSDADRKLRFAQEAKAASALNHPNIVTIYDIAEHDGQSFIVMEFIDGSPLSDSIPKRGMKLTEALRVAVQVADALSAAHAAGIVHRDLKPANIMLDSQSRVKVLDFGLAKLIAPAPAPQSVQTETVAMHPPVTEVGAIVGSVPYMSPEQAEGKPVDARSDIFSFGAVLYEMVTGQRAFSGESRASTLAAVLDRDPRPPSDISQSIPPELERLIARCLRKDVNKRSQHMSDVKLALEELRDESESGKLMRPVPAAAHQRSPKWLWPAVALGLILAGGAAWIYHRRSVSAPFRAPELTRLSPDDGYSYSAPAISPDGKLVAYVSDRSGKPELWLQQVGGNVPIQLTHSQNQVAKAEFFPDGTRILYLTTSPTPDRKDTFEVISTLGGEPQVLASGSFPFSKFPNFDISPDGRQIAYFERAPSRAPRLMIVPSDGGQPRSLPEWTHTQHKSVFVPLVRWTPDGRYLLCGGSKKADAENFDDWDWFLIPTNGGSPVATGASDRLRAAGFNFPFPSAIAGGRALFSGPQLERGHVWQVKLSPGTWRLNGDPQQLTFGTEDEVAVSVSTDSLAAVQIGKLYTDLYLVPLDGTSGNASGITRRLTQDSRDKVLSDSLIRGGGGNSPSAYFWLASEIPGGGFTLDGYNLDLKSGRQNRVTTLPTLAALWTVSGDGRQIAYSLPDGDAYTIRLGEVGSPSDSARMLCRACGAAYAFSPDGNFLLYDPARPVRPNPDRKASIHLLDLRSGTDKPWLEDPTDSLELQGFAGQKNEWALMSARPPKAPVTSARGFLVPWREQPVPRSEWIALPATASPARISQKTGGGAALKLSAAGNLLYFFQGSELQVMRFNPQTKQFGAPAQVRFAPGSQPVPRPDDAWTIRAPGIVFQRTETKSSVWLMKLPQQ